VTDVLDEWSRRHLDEVAELEAGWPDAAAGDTLLHADLRADNVLLGPDGVVFVDWAHACRGAPVFDIVAWAPSVALQGGPSPEELVARYQPGAEADPDATTAIVAAIAGYFTHGATKPAPPGLPGLRPFQAAQGEVARAWLRRRTGLP
jgi:Ser/Thr protein kinase RdoA (MazF antagonist)